MLSEIDLISHAMKLRHGHVECDGENLAEETLRIHSAQWRCHSPFCADGFAWSPRLAGDNSWATRTHLHRRVRQGRRKDTSATSQPQV